MLLALLLVTSAMLDAAPRSRAVVRRFMVASGYPHGRPGYVVDHVIPLCAGGPDTPANMQWQDIRASYRKDVYERALCAALQREGYVLVKRRP
jgi:hypothetical protein